MAEQHNSDSGSSQQSLAWLYPLALIFSLVLIATGGYLAHRSGNWAILTVGFASLMGVLVAWPIAMQLQLFHSASCNNADKALASINERFEEFSIMINLISEQQLLSDRAKSVAFREKDSDALRRAIQDEMQKQNWEAAASLADEMQESFGYKQEAERLRKEIEDRHQDVIRKQVNDSLAVIDRHVRGESWEEALKEAQRAAAAYPSNPQALMLADEVEKRRQSHKQQLIDSWNDAVSRHDTDGAIEILKRLDAYLTPTEAEAYQESVRGVFKEKMHNLRAQLAVAVQDRQWSEAMRIGEQITTEFPNSQMAKEVREIIDSLRLRSQGLEPEPVG